jgi:succinate dehydrogenase/fumarate reductase-like Fe-S protein
VNESATLKIWRGLDANDGRWEIHEVPFEAGQSVLDGLRWIRANRDPTLAIRFSCINANACKECMVELDGKTVYACTARLQPREMTLAPLSNKKLRVIWSLKSRPRQSVSPTDNVRFRG